MRSTWSKQEVGGYTSYCKLLYLPANVSKRKWYMCICACAHFMQIASAGMLPCAIIFACACYNAFPSWCNIADGSYKLLRIELCPVMIILATVSSCPDLHCKRRGFLSASRMPKPDQAGNLATGGLTGTHPEDPAGSTAAAASADDGGAASGGPFAGGLQQAMATAGKGTRQAQTAGLTGGSVAKKPKTEKVRSFTTLPCSLC